MRLRTSALSVILANSVHNVEGEFLDHEHPTGGLAHQISGSEQPLEGLMISNKGEVDPVQVVTQGAPPNSSMTTSLCDAADLYKLGPGLLKLRLAAAAWQTALGGLFILIAQSEAGVVAHKGSEGSPGHIREMMAAADLGGQGCCSCWSSRAAAVVRQVRPAVPLPWQPNGGGQWIHRCCTAAAGGEGRPLLGRCCKGAATEAEWAGTVLRQLVKLSGSRPAGATPSGTEGEAI